MVVTQRAVPHGSASSRFSVPTPRTTRRTPASQQGAHFEAACRSMLRSHLLRIDEVQAGRYPLLEAGLLTSH